MQFTYLMVVFFSAIVPFIFSFHPKLKFYKHFGSFIKANLIIGSLFVCWDIYFTKIGVWSFNGDYTMGIFLANLPLEEVLFFICIPFACLFTIHCFSVFFDLKWSDLSEKLFVLAFSFILIVLGLINYEKAYTSSTFISTAIILFLIKFYFKVAWIGIFFSIFPILLIPFFIVNGILTGTGLENPIVSYNDNENLGIRLLTIPIEDMFYGIELLVLNFFLFSVFRSKKQKIK